MVTYVDFYLFKKYNTTAHHVSCAARV